MCQHDPRAFLLNIVTGAEGHQPRHRKNALSCIKALFTKLKLVPFEIWPHNCLWSPFSQRVYIVLWVRIRENWWAQIVSNHHEIEQEETLSGLLYSPMTRSVQHCIQHSFSSTNSTSFINKPHSHLIFHPVVGFWVFVQLQNWTFWYLGREAFGFNLNCWRHRNIQQIISLSPWFPLLSLSMLLLSDLSLLYELRK